MIVVILALSIAGLAGTSSLNSPQVLPANADSQSFSAERAMDHVEAIARQPHPVGSLDNARVRDYILGQLEAMGLSPEVQKSTSLTPLRDNVNASIVNNIMATIPGTDPSRTIVLNAHYDSMPMTPGAADCGSCVATLLETARALQASPPLQKDVALVFTDDEELGPMAGAEAFVDQLTPMASVGLVLNFEGIGRTGPSIMFETGPDSGWLVQEWGKATSHPVAQSWFHDVYRLTPINTDLTIYSGAGISGLNFWNMFGGTVYHTELDTASNLDPLSLQHHGDNALSLTRRVGDLDLNEAARSGDAVYFSLFPGVMVTYPASTAPIFALLAGLAVTLVAIVGFRRRRLTLRGSLVGLLASLLSVVLAAGLATGIWMGIVQLHGEYQSMLTFGRVYNAPLYILAFAALSLAIASTLYVLFRRRVKSTDLAFGAFVLTLILALAASFMLPGMSYLFTWALLFSALATGWVLWREPSAGRGWRTELILLAGVLPGVFIIVPNLVVIFGFGPMVMIGGGIVVLAVLLGLLTPQLDLMTRSHRWWLPGVMAIISLGFLVAGSLTAGFDEEHPRPNGMAYLLDTDRDQATWFSPGPQADDWTTQFYSTDPDRGTLGELFPIAQRSRFPVLQGDAPLTDLDPPQLVVLDDETIGEVRRLELRLSSPRQAPIIGLDVEPRTAVLGVEIGGRRMTVPESEQTLWSLAHHSVPLEGVEVVLEVVPSQPLTVQLSDNSRELPDIQGQTFQPRSADMMPMPNFDYGTVVVRTLDIP